MKLSIALGMLGLAAMTAQCARSAVPARPELSRSHRWVLARFGNRAGARPPFAFTYGGTPSEKLLSEWTMRRETRVLDAVRVERTIVYTDPRTGLEVRCVSVEYRDLPAVEWVLTFRNTGPADTPILEDVCSASLSVTDSAGDFTVRYADGSHEQTTDFQPHSRSLAVGDDLDLAPYGGRSSDGVVPFFNLVRRGGGMMLGVGWSGQWAASFHRAAVRRLVFKAGMQKTHLVLHPGEKIRSPSMLLLFYDGEPMRGHNLLRSLIMAHYCPMVDGKPAALPVAASGATIGLNSMSEANQLQAIENVVARKLPVDTYWIDAGWSRGGFPDGMGTWDPDPVRFPHGLGLLGDAAHRAGLKFLLWFEPERVMPGSWLRLHHPEWLLAPSNLPREVSYQKDWRLLNLGDPAALAWATHTFALMVDSFHVDIYRQDFNMHPLWYWRGVEPPNRQGMNEIRYVEGLYAFWDALLRSKPGLLIDNCASGGRRIDFEMMRRSVPLWRSDHVWDPVAAQSIMYGLSYWIPLQGLGSISADPYDLRSGMGACVSYAFDYYSPGAAFWKPLRVRIDEYRNVRACFTGDFYPLTTYSVNADAWLAWQFDRPDLGEGIVQAFRRPKCAAAALLVRLVGLDAAARYELADMDGALARTATGRSLMEDGVTVTLDSAPKSALFHYRKIK